MEDKREISWEQENGGREANSIKRERWGRGN